LRGACAVLAAAVLAAVAGGCGSSQDAATPPEVQGLERLAARVRAAAADGDEARARAAAADLRRYVDGLERRGLFRPGERRALERELRRLGAALEGPGRNRRTPHAADRRPVAPVAPEPVAASRPATTGAPVRPAPRRAPEPVRAPRERDQAATEHDAAEPEDDADRDVEAPAGDEAEPVGDAPEGGTPATGTPSLGEEGPEEERGEGGVDDDGRGKGRGHGDDD
jgi:hypothetical protein